MRRRPGLAMVAVAALAGCGLQPDSAPRDIRPVDQPAVGDATPTTRPLAGQSAKIFMISPDAAGRPVTLAAVRRDLDPTAAVRVTALLAGLTAEEQGQRLQTAIPTGTRLLSAEVRSSGVALVNLSEDFIAVSDTQLAHAVAQLVFTLTQLPDVHRVQLLINGQPLDSPRGDGTLTASPLTPFDFPGLNPSSQPPYPVIPSATIPETTPTT